MTIEIDFEKEGKKFHLLLKSTGKDYAALIYEKSKTSDLVTPVSVSWVNAKSEEKAIEKVIKFFVKSNGKKGLFDLYGKKRVRV